MAMSRGSFWEVVNIYIYIIYIYVVSYRSLFTPSFQGWSRDVSVGPDLKWVWGHAIQKEIEPASGAAAIGLLETILSIPEPPKGTPLRDLILAIERPFEDYEVSSNEKLGENLKVATLRKLLPPELKVHATLLVKGGTTYQHVKKAVTEYEVADRSFQALKPGAIYSGTILTCK